MYECGHKGCRSTKFKVEFIPDGQAEREQSKRITLNPARKEMTLNLQRPCLKIICAKCKNEETVAICHTVTMPYMEIIE